MDIMELLAGRRTYRRFLQKPVPAGVVADMVEAVRLSSCGANRQAIRLVVVQSPAMVAKVQPLVKWAAYLPPEQGVPKPGEQPVLFVAVVQDASIPGDKDSDAGIALANLTLAAWAKGVGSCIMGAIDRPRLTELLGLSENEKLHSMVALGYPAHASRVVPLTEATGVKYYLDENRDYCVPKRAAAGIARFV
ncbi:MAG TPA: nitroreductase family protein [Candidatus Faecalibacterium faecigallinarum]|uniref:Nitroreductase family protein n=1 Tax=Candidatus Faecalibacterium faecigallinarum TaxID=2838577 RepID=A0A9D2P8W3_9FIRM|nr:nitroreductase family protein [Candidatus Faecalibacterium faecigallinarum]